jgi:short-subunit dehydrogenase
MIKKTALITGASSGIGRELAIIHAERGGNLVIVARSKELLELFKKELEQKYSISVYVIVQDLSQPNAAEEIYKEVQSKGIVIDYLINNAGFGGQGKFYERAWEQDLKMINVNIIALTALTRFFLPDFVKRNDGKILNVSSTASFMPGPLQAVYFATKAFVTSFSNAISEELRNTTITVTTLLPGATETKFASTSGMDNSALFKNAANAKNVAMDGYKGMLAGKLNVISGVPLSRRLSIALIPFVTKRMVMKEILKMQEVL